MSSANPKLIGLCGFPEEGEYVPVDARAEAVLIRQGWTPPPPEVWKSDKPLTGFGINGGLAA